MKSVVVVELTIKQISVVTGGFCLCVDDIGAVASSPLINQDTQCYQFCCTSLSPVTEYMKWGSNKDLKKAIKVLKSCSVTPDLSVSDKLVKYNEPIIIVDNILSYM